MNPRILITVLLVLSTVQLAQAGGWFWPPEKTFTLAEFSKTPGVKVKIETLSKGDAFDLPIADHPNFRPVKKVTILLFQNANFFSPMFFKYLPGFGRPGEYHGFPSGLKVHLVVAGPDKAVLSCTSVVYDTFSDADAAEMHINITFLVAAELMDNSYLLLNEEFPRSGGQMIPVYFGARP